MQVKTEQLFLCVVTFCEKKIIFLSHNISPNLFNFQKKKKAIVSQINNK